MKADELDRRTHVSAKHPHADMIGRSPSDRRFAPRRKGQIPAMVFFENTSVTMPCRIVDMSTTGARLELRAGWDSSVPSDIDRVKLVLRSDRVMYECRIIRRAQTGIGLKFTAPPRMIAKAPEPARRPQAR